MRWKVYGSERAKAKKKQNIVEWLRVFFQQQQQKWYKCDDDGDGDNDDNEYREQARKMNAQEERCKMK